MELDHSEFFDQVKATEKDKTIGISPITITGEDDFKCIKDAIKKAEKAVEQRTNPLAQDEDFFIPIRFNNASNLNFTDISSEEYRTYHFTSGYTIRIDAPTLLNVSPSGGHRLFDASGMSHYIPKGWVHLKWKARPGSPHFVK
jgi:hypothetical protein